MSAIDTLFQQLRAAGRKALMPFVTAGDPDIAFTAAVLQELAAAGPVSANLAFLIATRLPMGR